MADPSRSTRFRARFDSALQAYQETTNVTFTAHPIAVRLLDSNSVESITTILLYEARAFSNLRGFDRITKAIESIVSTLSSLSSTAPVGNANGLVRRRADGVFRTSDNLCSHSRPLKQYRLAWQSYLLYVHFYRSHVVLVTSK